MSVTNDIRNVLQSLIDKGYDLHKYKVIYKDSSFIYDAILINPDNTFHSFASLNQFTPETAMSRYDERIKNHSLI